MPAATAFKEVQVARLHIRSIRPDLSPLACSFDPKLTNTQATQLLQQCLLQEPVCNNVPEAKTIRKDIDDCVLDLCCTSVQGPGDLLVSCMSAVTLLLPNCHLCNLPNLSLVHSH